jgi:hypothetical protein
MTEKRVSSQEWFEWTNSVYKTRLGRLFIQQLFRICRFWSSPKTLMAAGFSPQELMAYENLCKQILNGLSNENIADLFANTRKSEE